MKAKLNKLFEQVKAYLATIMKKLHKTKKLEQSDYSRTVSTNQAKTSEETPQENLVEEAQEIDPATKSELEAIELLPKQKSIFMKFQSTSRKNKKRQYVMAGILAAIVSVVGLYMFSAEDDEPVLKVESGFIPDFKGTKLKNLETSKDNINPDEIFKFQLEKDKQETKSELKEVRETLIKLNERNNQPGTNNHEVIDLKKRLEFLESSLNRIGLGMQANRDNPQVLSISKINVRLIDKEQKKLKTVDNTIPAGSFAAGVLLSGLDASTSLSSSGNPTPMLIRLTDHGTLPRRFKSDLQDCHVIASGYGDISSERVLTRLERLTCVERLTGEILETAIAGYISGEDGKAGIRGVVVSKDFKYLANSAMGGIIGGLSNTLSPKQNLAPFIASKEALSPPPLTERFQTGFAGGMSSSMDKLSQYYIDRAETLQPVIEVSAGRLVDIIFTQGVEIGSTTVKHELSLVRDESRKQAAKSSANGEE